MTSPSQPAAAGVGAPSSDPGQLPGGTGEEAEKLTGRSPGQLMWRRFKRDRAGVLSAYIVILFLASAALAPVISRLYGKDPYTTYGLDRPGLLNEFFYPVKPNGGIDGEFWFGLEPGLGKA